MTLRISHLAGVYTGSGFQKKDGQNPQPDDCGFLEGPLDILCDPETGKILSIEKSSTSAGLQKKNEQVCLAEGMVAMPGFVDSHTHALYYGNRAKEYFLRWAGKSYREIADQGGGIHNTVSALGSAKETDLQDFFFRTLKKILLSGTTTLEIKSGYSRSLSEELRALRFVKKFERSGFLPLQIRKTFLALHALPPGRIEVDFVDEMISGLDTIKQEALADYVDAFPEEGFFSLEQSLRFAREAQARGLGVKIHADEITNMRSAENFADMGALSVDHLQKISREGFDALSYSKTVATLLPATSFFLGIEYAPARKLLDRGLRVALATDFNPGTAPESGFQLTFRLAASQMKMSSAEIFCAATYNGAKALGLESSCGHLAPGTRADILLFETKDASGFLDNMIVSGETPSKIIAGAKEYRF